MIRFSRLLMEHFPCINWSIFQNKTAAPGLILIWHQLYRLLMLLGIQFKLMPFTSQASCYLYRMINSFSSINSFRASLTFAWGKCRQMHCQRRKFLDLWQIYLLMLKENQEIHFLTPCCQLSFPICQRKAAWRTWRVMAMMRVFRMKHEDCWMVMDWIPH